MKYLVAYHPALAFPALFQRTCLSDRAAARAIVQSRLNLLYPKRHRLTITQAGPGVSYYLIFSADMMRCIAVDDEQLVWDLLADNNCVLWWNRSIGFYPAFIKSTV